MIVNIFLDKPWEKVFHNCRFYLRWIVLFKKVLSY